MSGLVFSAKGDLAKQFGKYFLAALVGLLVDYSTLIFTREILEFHYLIASILGFITGLVVVYFISNRFVFGEQKIQSNMQNFMLFGLIGLVGLGILSLLMWLLTGLLGLNYILSKTIATIFVFAWNFLARRTLYKT